LVVCADGYRSLGCFTLRSGRRCVARHLHPGIFTVTAPGYHRGRVCLVGDAGTLYPPFTGGGVFEAINNAVEPDTDGDADQALAAWNDGNSDRGDVRSYR